MDQVLFSVNEYDSEGDISDRGIFLHFGNTKIKVADSSFDFKCFITKLSNMYEEIKEDYRGI